MPPVTWLNVPPIPSYVHDFVNSSKGTTMFTTTLTRTETQPEVVELPFGPGDIVHWPALGDAYHCYHQVEKIYMEDSYAGGTYKDVPFAKMWKAHDTSRTSLHYWTNPVENFKDVRVVKSNRKRTVDGFEPYRFKTGKTTTVEVPFDVEHKFQVGDVIQNKYGGTFTVERVELNRNGVPAYKYVDNGWDRIEAADGGYGFVLIGGPRYVAPSRFNVGDKIVWPNTIAGEYYTVTAVHGKERYGITSSRTGREWSSFYAPEKVKLFGEPVAEPVAEPVKPIEILRTARGLISVPDKWTKGSWDTGSQMCLSGAINRAATGVDGSDSPKSGPTREAWQAARDAVQDAIPGRQEIINFNDTPERTHEQVLAVLDKAIAELVLADV
jgi:hypothetical protein